MTHHNGYQPRQPMPGAAPVPPPEPPRMRCNKERRRLSGHDVYDASLAVPGLRAMGLADCHAVAQILNRKLGLL